MFIVGRSVNSNVIRRTRKEAVEFVVNSFRELQIDMSPSSRLMQMYRVMADDKDLLEPTHPDFDVGLEAVRDIQQFEFIFDNLNSLHSSDEFLKKLKRSTKDSVPPQENKKNSFGRDCQFELFIAAICIAADFQSVRLSEPDVIAEDWNSTFAIAAKRIKNVDRLSERIKEAVSQIGNVGLTGIIAIDTTLALNRTNSRITQNLPDQYFGQIWKQALDVFFKDRIEQIKNRIASTNVCGIVVHDHQVRLDQKYKWNLESFTYFINSHDNSQLENELFKLFEAKYRNGLPNMQDF